MAVPIPGPSGDQTGALNDDPLAFLAKVSSEYGDIAGFWTKGERVVLANNASAVAEVLNAGERRFTKAGTPDQQMLSALLGRGLLTVNGKMWEEQRKRYAPVFRPRQVEAFDGVMADSAHDHAQRWLDARQPTSESVNVELESEFSALTLEILVESIFGLELRGSLGAAFGDLVLVTNRYMAAEQRAGLEDVTSSSTDRGSFLRARGYLRAMVAQLLAAGRTLQDTGTLPVAIGRLLPTGRDVSDPDVIDELLTVLMAGHETTAKCLTWAFLLLMRNPDHLGSVQVEIDSTLEGCRATSRDLDRLPICAMVVQEALRLYPPVWLLSRRAAVDTTLDERPVPAGTLVCVSPYILHRHPVWHEGDSFAPQRFGKSPPLGYYIPFGAGPRSCIGRHFAMNETVLVLASMLQRLDFSLPSTAIELEALMTLRPAGGLTAVARERACKSATESS